MLPFFVIVCHPTPHLTNRWFFHIVENELKYVAGCLTYIVSRLTSKENGISITKRRFKPNNTEENAAGCFLNLHCGHNNHYSTEERDQLMALIRRCCDSDSV